MVEFAYAVVTEKSFAEACDAVEAAVADAGWALLGGYNFGEILAGKGFPQGESYRTFEICNAGHADFMLSHDQLVALCMPCVVLVFTSGDEVKLAALKPGYVLPALFDGKDDAFYERARQVDQDMMHILDAAR